MTRAAPFETTLLRACSLTGPEPRIMTVLSSRLLRTVSARSTATEATEILPSPMRVRVRTSFPVFRARWKSTPMILSAAPRWSAAS